MRPDARALLLIAVALLAAGILVSRTVGRDDPLQDARALVADDEGFGSATRSGVTLTRISERLEAAGERCLAEDGGNCDALFAGAGYSRVSAVGILRCTAPAIFEARAALRNYLERLSDGDPALNTPDAVRC